MSRHCVPSCTNGANVPWVPEKKVIRLWHTVAPSSDDEFALFQLLPPFRKQWTWRKWGFSKSAKHVLKTFQLPSVSLLCRRKTSMLVLPKLASMDQHTTVLCVFATIFLPSAIINVWNLLPDTGGFNSLTVFKHTTKCVNLITLVSFVTNVSKIWGQ